MASLFESSYNKPNIYTSMHYTYTDTNTHRRLVIINEILQIHKQHYCECVTWNPHAEHIFGARCCLFPYFIFEIRRFSISFVHANWRNALLFERNPYFVIQQSQQILFSPFGLRFWINGIIWSQNKV